MASKTAAAATPKQDVAENAVRNSVRALIEPRLKLVCGSASDVGNRFAAVLPLGQDFDAVKDPAFWALTAYKLRPGDTIEVHNDDMSFFGMLYVRDVSGAAGTRLNNRAIVAVLGYGELGPIKKELKSKTHEVRFLGPHEKWSIVALVDGKLVKGGFGTPEAAGQWMKTLG
jgi:hypothetical protein